MSSFTGRLTNLPRDAEGEADFSGECGHGGDKAMLAYLRSTRFWGDEAGASLSEYTILVALITGLVISVIGAVGISARENFEGAADELTASLYPGSGSSSGEGSASPPDGSNAPSGGSSGAGENSGAPAVADGGEVGGGSGGSSSPDNGSPGGGVDVIADGGPRGGSSSGGAGGSGSSPEGPGGASGKGPALADGGSSGVGASVGASVGAAGGSGPDSGGYQAHPNSASAESGGPIGSTPARAEEGNGGGALASLNYASGSDPGFPLSGSTGEARSGANTTSGASANGSDGATGTFEENRTSGDTLMIENSGGGTANVDPTQSAGDTIETEPTDQNTFQLADHLPGTGQAQMEPESTIGKDLATVFADALGIEPAASGSAEVETDEGFIELAVTSDKGSTDLSSSGSANLPPTAQDDFYDLVPGRTLVLSPTQGPLSNDSDPEGMPLSLVMETRVPNEDVGLFLDSEGRMILTVGEMQRGPVTLHYKAFDGELYSELATITIRVEKLERQGS